MSAFDERAPFKKRVVAVSLTEAQREEFDRLKAALDLKSDGAVVKRALASLSRDVLGGDPS